MAIKNKKQYDDRKWKPTHAVAFKKLMRPPSVSPNHIFGLPAYSKKCQPVVEVGHDGRRKYLIMEINSESVGAYMTILANPSGYGMSFRAITECFEESSTVTPNHLLAKDYIEKEATQLPKVFFYIIMVKLYGQCNGKAETGELGYYLKFKEKTK